jgi:hypothetical protein
VADLLGRNIEEVSVPKGVAHETFDMGADVMKAFRFFEGKKLYSIQPNGMIPTIQIVRDTVDSLGALLSFSPQNDGFMFSLNSLIRTPKLRPMNEVLAIYCCMFHLGSLVRYRPHVLESMLAKKDAWMIERFVKGAPITFLRHIRNMMDGRYLAYAVR